MPIASSALRFQFSHRRRASTAQHLGAFVWTGLLLMMAFPRPGWGWLAYVALVPAGIAAGRTTRWRRLFWTGAVVGGLWWWWQLRWLGPVSPAGPPVLGVWLGLHLSAGVLVAGVLHQKLRWPMVWALPLGWVSIEVLRTVWPAGGFAWFTLAQTQAHWNVGEVGRVVQTADLLGQHTVGLVVAMVNGAIVDALLRRKLPRSSVGLAAVVLVGAWGYGQWRIGQWESVTKDGPTVAVVQTDVQQDNAVRKTADDYVEDFRRLAELHEAAAGGSSDRQGNMDTEVSTPRERPDLIVWPETIVPFAINPEAVLHNQDASPFKAQLAEAAYGLVARDGVTTLAGSSTVLRDPDFRRYNSAYLIGPDGRAVGEAYHKQHRVPMGEYIPGPGFVESLIAWMSPWESSYELSPGRGPVVMTLPGGWQVGTPICYEDVVAGICREMVYGSADSTGSDSGGDAGGGGNSGGGKRLDALINLTNDGWYTGHGMRRQHAQLASLRCIENRVPMARSVNTGISTFIDSLGRCQARLDAFEAGTLTHTVQVDSRTTLYAALGGWPWVLFVLFTIGATVFAAIFGRPVAKHRIA